MYLINKYSHNWAIKRALNLHIDNGISHLHGSVVDLGCGERPFEQDILKYADRYTGVDWSNSIHNTQADIIADLNQPLDIESSSYDGVVSFEVLEHLCEPQIMLSEAYRILKKDGIFVMSLPFQWWLHEAPWDYQRFTRFGLEYQLNKAGFKDVQVYETTGFWLLWILKLNYQLKRIAQKWSVTHIFLVPFWFVAQWFAIALDKYWTEKNETAGYVVFARKTD